MGFSLRQGRNLAIAGAAAALTVAVAILLTHRSPAERRAALVSPAPATAKPQTGPAAVAAAPVPQRAAPTIQPLQPDTHTVAVANPAEVERPTPAAEIERAAPERAAPERVAPERAAPEPDTHVRSKHRATAHQRRYAKNERHAKHEKHARRERRSARPTQLASRGAPAPAAEGEARATYERGNAQLFAGDAAGAVSTYRKAVELAPSDPIGYRGLGLAYEQQGDTAAAIRALRKYLKLAPGAPDRAIISRRIARLSHAAGR